jgi:hypothetical protein
MYSEQLRMADKATMDSYTEFFVPECKYWQNTGQRATAVYKLKWEPLKYVLQKINGSEKGTTVL